MFSFLKLGEPLILFGKEMVPFIKINSKGIITRIDGFTEPNGIVSCFVLAPTDDDHPYLDFDKQDSNQDCSSLVGS